MQRLEGHDHLRRGTVWTCDDALRVQRVLWIDLRNHQSDIGVHSPVARFVDDFTASLDGRRQKGRSRVIWRTCDDKICACETVVGQFFDCDLCTVEFNLLTSTANGREV